MKKICNLILTIVFVFVLLPNNVLAETTEPQADYLYKKDFYPGELVTITGTGFGEYNLGSSVCFDSTDKCYIYGSPLIISWTDTEIIFVMTYGFAVPKAGHFTLYKDFDYEIATYAYDIDQKYFNDEWLYLQLYLSQINFDEAYDILTPKETVIVAVVDDGVYINHEDLEGKIWINDDEIAGDDIDNDKNGFVDDVFGYNFVHDTNTMNILGDHGTAVAGIIAANRDNSIGMAGLAEDVEIMPVIVCDLTGCDPDVVMDGIKYAIDNGAQIIELSLGSNVTSGYKKAYDDVMEYAHEKNVLVVTSAGNGDPENSKGMDLNVIPQSPVCNDVYDGNTMLGVGASDFSGYVAYWSNYGNDCVDIYAPGVDILTLLASGDDYTFTSGTSFSAPIISGLAANILSAYPNMRNYTLIDYIIENGNNNHGVVDAKALFSEVKKTYVDEGPFVYIKEESANTLDAGTSDIDDLANMNYFSDVNSSNTNAVAINFLKEQGILEGYSDGTFKPYQEVNRAEMLKILIKGGLNMEPGWQYQAGCFPDVKGTDWFAPYVCYAKENGWIEGYPDGNFKPAQSINKAEALKMLVMVNNVPAAAEQSIPYLDVEDAWYTKYVKACFSLNLLEETGNTLGIDQNITRGQISENIFRLFLINETNADSYEPTLLEKL